MRPSTLLLALPALAAAQQQPLLDNLKGWFNRASASVASAVSSATESISIPNPVASGAAKVAALNVHRLTLANHNTLFKHSTKSARSGVASGVETWQVLVTGGNKTCFGLCEHAETAWNESIALVAASSKAPNFALVDCDVEGVLVSTPPFPSLHTSPTPLTPALQCHAWAIGPPQLMHISLPAPLPSQSPAATDVRYISVNRTSVTPRDFAALTLQDKYLETEPYEGVWHPFDGPLAKYQVNVPIGQVISAFSMVPSWVFMILVSFVSRTFMSRRLGQQAGGRPAPAAAAPAQ